MYAKSFLALDSNGRLTGARTVQAAPYAHYTCHLCGSALRYHPQYDTELPWFEHTDDRLTEHGFDHCAIYLLIAGTYWFEHTDDRLTEHGQQCPYVRPERREIQLIKRLQQFVPDALPVVRKASWHCRQCHHDYYGERYCTHCQTGGFSIPRTTQEEICEF
ncbi:hypothetical protein BFD52_23085 [Escherichia coli]|nr:putative zinc ribbon protein [Escherichia coli]ROK47800.1 hypothetical protein BFD52_23085 [Escherichia coli]